MKNLILLLIFLTLVFSNSLFAGDIEITITGPDAPTNGSVYTATGGEAPYAWGISCGSISWTAGVVSGISNCCGKGIVVVKDACGYKAEKTVRMPKGNWVTRYDQYIGWELCFSAVNTTYIGDIWSQCVVTCTAANDYDSLLPGFTAAGGTCPALGTHSCGVCAEWYPGKRLSWGRVWQWRCQ